jgi:Sec-independent protein translocase protein TatA
VGKALGKAVGEFRRGIKEGLDEKDSSKTDPAPPSKQA